MTRPLPGLFENIELCYHLDVEAATDRRGGAGHFRERFPGGGKRAITSDRVRHGLCISILSKAGLILALALANANVSPSGGCWIAWLLDI